MPTRAGWTTLTVAALLVIAGRVFAIFELYIVATAMVALVACAVGWVLLNWRSVRVNRDLSPPRLHAGQQSMVTLELGNRRLLGTPVAQISDRVGGVVRADAHLPPLRRGATTRAGYRVPTDRRGMVPIGPMQTTVVDPFGLARVTRRSAPDVELLVLPPIEAIVPPPLPGGETAPLPDRIPGRIGHHGEEFNSLREYEIGDDLRRVHWPSSARQGDLVVRVEQITEFGQTMVTLDNRVSAASAETFERMVSAAASVITACHQRGDLTTLAFSDGTAMTIESPTTYERAMDALAVVSQRGGDLPGHAPSGGQSGTSVWITGSTAEAVIAHQSPRERRQAGVIVSFTEATQPLDRSAVPSILVVDVVPDAGFADTWNRQVGHRTRTGA